MKRSYNKKYRFPKMEQAVIEAFLINWQTAAERGLKGAKKIADVRPDFPGAEGLVAHWRNTRSAILWLRSHISSPIDRLCLPEDYVPAGEN